MADLLVLSRDEIMDCYLRDFRSGARGVVTGTNSDAWIRAKAIADVALPLYANSVTLSKESYPGTASEATLNRDGRTYSVPRLGAVNASGVGTTTSSLATTVPDGSQLINPSTGEQYITIGDTIIGLSLTASAFIAALDPGVGGNAESGTILNYIAPPPGVSSVVTVQSIAGGDEQWSIARWAKEILRRMRQAPRGGNEAHFIELALSITGLEQAFVYSSLRGRGTMDVILTTSAASGTRTAGNAVIQRYLGAMQYGSRALGGGFVPGIPADVLANTTVSAPVEQPTNILITMKGSAANPFASWPPYGPGYVVSTNPDTWYTVQSSISTTSFNVGIVTGTPVAPVAGNAIGIYFQSVGFCKGTIISVVATSATTWDIVVNSWTSSTGALPTETVADVDNIVTPWCSQLPLIAGAPATNSLALSGAVPDFFAAMGPGEMTPLVAADTSRRRRWPRVTETNPLSGLAEWPIDVTARASSAVVDATDAADLTLSVRSGYASTPDVPLAPFMGTPPSILTCGFIFVIPF